MLKYLSFVFLAGVASAYLNHGIAPYHGSSSIYQASYHQPSYHQASYQPSYHQASYQPSYHQASYHQAPVVISSQKAYATPVSAVSTYVKNVPAPSYSAVHAPRVHTVAPSYYSSSVYSHAPMIGDHQYISLGHGAQLHSGSYGSYGF